MSATYFDTREFEDLARATLEFDPLAMGSITSWCERQCASRGVPFHTIYERRWNDRGEPIGPRMEISHDAASLVLTVAEAMATARDREFQRILALRATGPVPD